jgi:hypothetical protein
VRAIADGIAAAKSRVTEEELTAPTEAPAAPADETPSEPEATEPEPAGEPVNAVAAPADEATGAAE